MAPTASGETHCTYCRAPLTWRPILSPSASDDGFSIEDRETGVLALPFGPESVLAGQTMNFQCRPQLVMRPTHLYVPLHVAEPFVVKDMRIGNTSYFAASGAIPAAMCSDGRGLPLFEEKTVVTPGLFLTLIVQNLSTRTAAFHAAVRGQRMKEAPRLERSRSPGLREWNGRTGSRFSMAHPIDFYNAANFER